MKDKTSSINPNIQLSTTHKLTTGCGTMYLTVCRNGQAITDIIVKIGKSGGCAQAQVECIANLLSTSIKAGVDPLVLTNQMIGIRCSSPVYQFGEDVLSCGDAIGRFLKNYLDNSASQEIEADESAEPSNE
jgi:ribonucleoside-diphosphate reductase alpha chain